MQFECPYFQITLPDDMTDASSYCFALPASSRFHPSIVIKFDKLPKGKTLQSHVDAQVAKSSEQLKNYVLLVRPAASGPDQISLQCQWGTGESSFQQTQIFRQQGERIFVLTSTLLLMDAGPENAKMVDAALRSFKPKPSAP